MPAKKTPAKKKATKKTQTKTGAKIGRPPKGRPSSLTPEIQEEFCRWIRAGNYIETAAHLMKIHKDVIFLWMRNGAKQKTGKYVEFLKAVREAQAESETKLLSLVNNAGRKDWRAAAWRLERMKPKRYGPGALKTDDDKKTDSGRRHFKLVMVDGDQD
jgi:hypothetical protein